MIRSFKDKDTENLYRLQSVRKFSGIERQALKRLRILDSADTLQVLALLPSNRLEALKGDRRGQYSIRINDQWRICFRWAMVPLMLKLWITISEVRMSDWRDPIHPGEILADELGEIGMKAVELAHRIGVPDNRIYQILRGQRSITADTALRLGKFFNTGPEFWLNLQKAYELDVARQQLGDSLAAIIPYQPIVGNGRGQLVLPTS